MNKENKKKVGNEDSIEEIKDVSRELDSDNIDGYNDDVVFDDELSGSNKIKKIRDQLKECQKQKQEYLDGWQRSKADMINQKKNFETTRKEYISYASEQFVEELFPVLDSYHMAFADKETWNKVDKNWRVGVEYIYTQLLSALENNGLSITDPQGEKFDPSLHNSIDTVVVDNEKMDGTIVTVVQKGYLINSKVVKPARVKVGVYKEKDKGTTE